jgi:hypothetical protein
MGATPPKPLTDGAVFRNRRGSAKVFAIFRVAVHQTRHCFTDRTLRPELRLRNFGICFRQ